MRKQDTRTTLIEAGENLMLANGYNNTGLQDIVKAAGVPKGSFYHFFPSKEVFAHEVLTHHLQQAEPAIVACLTAADVPPLQRLEHFFTAARNSMADKQCEGGCLVGNLAQELADQNEAFRLRLDGVMQHWQGQIEHSLEDARQAGEIDVETDVANLSRFLLDSWEGALMRSKVTKNTEPMDSFMQVVFGSILKRN